MWSGHIRTGKARRGDLVDTHTGTWLQNPGFAPPWHPWSAPNAGKEDLHLVTWIHCRFLWRLNDVRTSSLKRRLCVSCGEDALQCSKVRWESTHSVVARGQIPTPFHNFRHPVALSETLLFSFILFVPSFGKLPTHANIWGNKRDTDALTIRKIPNHKEKSLKVMWPAVSQLHRQRIQAPQQNNSTNRRAKFMSCNLGWTAAENTSEHNLLNVAGIQVGMQWRVALRVSMCCTNGAPMHS